MTRAEPWVKICGVTRPEDASAALAAGASAIGLNFVPSSRRYVEPGRARAIADAVRGKLEIVGVVADLEPRALAELESEVGLDWIQLHGDERAELVQSLPRAFKAVGIATATDVERALTFPGERLLVDAKLEGTLGGTGQPFDWMLVRDAASSRRLIVAGGLTPENVAEAVRVVQPWGVDVASGVEPPGQPGRKDPEKMARFVRAAQREPSSDE